MSDSPGPIEPELDALLDRERARKPPEAALERVWSRVTLSVAAGAPVHAPSGRSGGGDSPWVAPHAKTLIALAFVAGAAAGAGIHAALLPSRSAPVDSRPSPTPSEPAPVSTPPPTPELNVSAAPAPVPPPPIARPTRTTAASAAAPPVSSLSAEREVLDKARVALAAGDGPGALASIDEHTRRFPRPQLVEEREALAVQALVVQGRYDEARVRAARFRSAWPNSLFLPAVEATLSSIP
jgi:hypothetical protein